MYYYSIVMNCQFCSVDCVNEKLGPSVVHYARTHIYTYTTSSRVRRGDNGQEEVSQRARRRGGDLHPRSSGQGQPHLTVVSSVVPLTPPQRGLLTLTSSVQLLYIYIRSPVATNIRTSRFILLVYQQQWTVSNVQCIHTYYYYLHFFCCKKLTLF